MKGKRRECKAEVGAPLAVVVVPRCRGVNEDEKSEATKYYVIIQATWSHDSVLSEKKKSYRHRLPFLLSITSPTYTHNPGFNMSVDLTKLEAHLSTRSYVEG